MINNRDKLEASRKHYIKEMEYMLVAGYDKPDQQLNFMTLDRFRNIVEAIDLVLSNLEDEPSVYETRGITTI